MINLLTTYGNKTMNRFDFTDYSNIRALVDAAARAVNDQYSDLRKARKEYTDGTGTRAFIDLKTRQHEEALALSYTLHAESYMMRADEEEIDATTAVHHARVAEHRACAATYLARADEARADAEAAKARWLAGES